MATENRKPAAAGGRESAGRRAGLPAGTRSSALRNPTVGQSPPGLQVARAGRFRSLGHATTGRAIVLRRPAGHLILWLVRLSTSNGPTCGPTYPVSRPVATCPPTGPDSSTWARSRATGPPELCHPGRHRPFGIQQRGHLVPQIRSWIRRSPTETLNPSQATDHPWRSTGESGQRQQCRADRRLGARYSQSLLSGRRSAGLPAKEPFQEPTRTDFRRPPATPGDCFARSSAQ